MASGGCHADEGAPLQRLFSTFPAGWPGAGLLVLRLAVGCAAVVAGGVCLWGDAGSLAVRVAIGVLLGASGGSLLAGFLTPFAAVVIGSCACALALSLVPAPSTTFADPAAATLVVLVAVAIALLGPGAYSLDSHLFGRREIVIAPGHSTVTVPGDTQPGLSPGTLKVECPRGEGGCFCVQSAVTGLASASRHDRSGPRNR